MSVPKNEDDVKDEATYEECQHMPVKEETTDLVDYHLTNNARFRCTFCGEYFFCERLFSLHVHRHYMTEVETEGNMDSSTENLPLTWFESSFKFVTDNDNIDYDINSKPNMPKEQ